MQHSILVVDDEKDIVDSIERQFRKKYKILKAYSGIEALRVLQTEQVQLILSDQRMPEMTGVQLFERAQKIQPEAIRILLTGFTDVESVIAAINAGQIYRYITKPWDPTDLDVIVRRALDTYDLRTELKEKNKSLETALAELKTLDQAKSQFMILIGHELKTPLTTASSFLDLLKEEKLAGDAQKYVLRVSQGVGRLREVVFDVLDLMGAEMKQTKLKRGQQSVNELVAIVAGELAEIVSQRNLELRVTDTKTKAYFDPGIITKVFRKILHNAVKFADPGSTVVVDFSNAAGGNVEIAVTNKGPTIPADRIEAILKPFTLDEDIMHHSQGMGLGLSVAQSLLKLHGAELKIRSQSQKTTVSFALPLKES